MNNANIKVYEINNSIFFMRRFVTDFWAIGAKRIPPKRNGKQRPICSGLVIQKHERPNGGGGR